MCKKTEKRRAPSHVEKSHTCHTQQILKNVRKNLADYVASCRRNCNLHTFFSVSYLTNLSNAKIKRSCNACVCVNQ